MNRAARTDLALDALNEERDHLTIQISLQDHAETPEPPHQLNWGPAGRARPIEIIAWPTSRPPTSTLRTSPPFGSVDAAPTVTLPVLSRLARRTAASIPRLRSASHWAPWICGTSMPAMRTVSPLARMVPASSTQLGPNSLKHWPKWRALASASGSPEKTV